MTSCGEDCQSFDRRKRRLKPLLRTPALGAGLDVPRCGGLAVKLWTTLRGASVFHRALTPLTEDGRCRAWHVPVASALAGEGRSHTSSACVMPVAAVDCAGGKRQFRLPTQ